MHVPIDIQHRILSRLPIDLRVALRVKPGRVKGHTQAVVNVLDRWRTILYNPYRLHHAYVRVREHRYGAIIIWNPVKEKYVAFLRGICGRFSFHADLVQPTQGFHLAWESVRCVICFDPYDNGLFEAAHKHLIRIFDACQIQHAGPWTRSRQERYPYYIFMPKSPELVPPLPKAGYMMCLWTPVPS